VAEATPMMQQYRRIKEQNKDCILFFRLGDFYEMFDDDARLASKELDLVLTSRDRSVENTEDRTPMCGIPYHSSEAYIARLLARGFKVAICEQTEDPALAKGLVQRDVVRIITPGTVIDASMLEESRNNFICSIHAGPGGIGLCFADISTGEVCATLAEGGDAADHMLNELGRFRPSEVVISDAAAAQDGLREMIRERLGLSAQQLSDERFGYGAALPVIFRQFHAADLAALGLQDKPETVCAIGGLFSYLADTQKTELTHLNRLDYYEKGRFMELDLNTRRNLELCESLRAGEKRGSLLGVLDKTRTAMGGRLLRTWIERPLLSPAAIKRRLNAVAELRGDTVGLGELSLSFKGMGDMERLIGRVVYGSAGCRDLRALSQSAALIPALKAKLSGYSSGLLQELCQEMDELADVRSLIDSAVIDDPPFSVREGGFIRDGYSREVDSLRAVMSGGRGSVAAMEAAEREKTGIKSLKVGYNRVFGYYIEVSRSYLSQVPDTYIRKQTLVNNERFITQELKEMESTILGAQERITALEYELFCELREKVASQLDRIQKTAAAVAAADVLCSLADVAGRYRYCMPEVDYSDVISIREGRHPVVEQMLSDSLFVPNDAYLDNKDDCVSIITGPNMAGKSTYMRQVALITLLAQIGSFVPAASAHIGVVDRIFTRIGASDDLSSGRSTFMVEMTEVADILKSATSRSLLILDEIGRGTSTFDGMSIARAVLEHCADKNKLGAKTLFATHYHELTVLEQELPSIKNYNIAVKKRGDDIIFLRKIVRGGADDSYGIEVASLAGVPQSVIGRAKTVLSRLEEGAPVTPARKKHGHTEPENAQVTLTDMRADEILGALRETDVNVMTPIEAMGMLHALTQKAKQE